MAHDLLGRLEVVLGDGLLEVAAGAGELAGVDVDDRHGLRAVDDQGAAGGQPHLAVHRLGQLFVDAVHREHIRACRSRLAGGIGLCPAGGIVLGQLRKKFGSNRIHVAGDGFPGVFTGDDQAGEVLVEQIPDDLDQDIGLLVEGDRRACLVGFDTFGFLGDLGPPLLQPVDVGADVVFLDPFGCGADDHPGLSRNHLAQDVLESLTFGIGKLAADAGRGRSGDVDQVAAGQRNLRGEPPTLVPDRILADLHHDVVAGLERLLDLAVCAAESGGFPVDLAGVEDTVAAAADVDEGRLHRRQHVLDDAKIDVADHRCRGGRRHEVLDDDAVLQHGDLGVARTLVRGIGADPVAHHHDPVHGLAAGQELGLGQDRRAAPACVAAVPATLTLGFQAGRSADALDLAVGACRFGARRTLVDDGVGRVIARGGLGVLARSGAAAASATTATGAAGGGFLVTGLLVVGIIAVLRSVLRAATGGLAGGRNGLVTGFVLVAIAVGLLAPAATATAPSAAAAAVGRPVGLGVLAVLGLIDVVVGVGVGVPVDVEGSGCDRLGRDE